MNDILSLSRTFQIKETGANTQPWFTGVIGNRLANGDATKELAQRLYAIGELNAAAQLLSELAARCYPYQAEGCGEAIRG
ncbi:MAG: hypothetical protein ABSH00_17810 [Bryobacteraceae bacterium]|jgi:hypothetical protein